MQIRKTQERVKLEENNYGSAALIYIFISFILCTMTLLMLYVSDMLLRLGVDLLLVHTPAPHKSTISTCTYTQTFPLHVARLWLPAPVVLDCSQYLLGLCIQKAFVCSLASALTLPSSSASVTRPFLRTRTSTTSHYQHSINKL